MSESISGIAANNGYKNITFTTGFPSGSTIVAAIPVINMNSYLNVSAYLTSATNAAVTFRVNNNGNAATTSGNLTVILLYI